MPINIYAGVSSKCISLQIKITFLWENPVCAINSTMFITYNLFVYSRHEVHSMNTHTVQNAG